jgi:4-diphosphocytidyl-2-C-methyl-D-erythritol kinase
LNVLTEIAPAKLNLSLHVRGRLADGRHAIETLFAFCRDGDVITVRPEAHLSLELSGPFGSLLAAEKDNLVLTAARALADFANVTKGAAITLEKRLPLASGLGGGSSDAAAALRLLTSLWKIDPSCAREIAPKLGSDVPACLAGVPAFGSGPGDELQPVDPNGFSNIPVLLVNPLVPLSTAKVFALWDGTDQGPLVDWKNGRNDLEPLAIRLAPQILSVREWLCRQKGVQLARMSGSGATFFALFDDEKCLRLAAEAVSAEWWHLATFLR